MQNKNIDGNLFVVLDPKKCLNKKRRSESKEKDNNYFHQLYYSFFLNYFFKIEIETLSKQNGNVNDNGKLKIILFYKYLVGTTILTTLSIGV